MRHHKAVVVAAIIVLGTRAAADPVFHLRTPSTVQTEGGSTLQLPPGYFIDEKGWQERDEALRKAQEDSTRYKAENKSLRESKTEYPWLATAYVGAFGVAVGIFFTVQAMK
jgi:hypothetical protein